jgi:hypothetical protein
VIKQAVYLILPLLLSACLAPQPLRLAGETVIDGDTTWSGEVRVEGRVIVTRTGSLTIEPGTKVSFVPFDEDGDGIGDGEILVEGKISAVGTKDAPILLTSAAKEPKRSDWKYLYLDFARYGELAHVISEYAYSGVQVHFCKASIRDSVFRHNVDGVSFSTVTLDLEYNDIYDNTHGIRYEERRGKAQVYHNDIRDNEIGIFVVTRSDDNSRFEANNIANNRYYSVKMGHTQASDVTLPGNWWGTEEADAIEQTFLDKRVDETLGRVNAPQPLQQPVEEAGRR